MNDVAARIEALLNTRSDLDDAALRAALELAKAAVEQQDGRRAA